MTRELFRVPCDRKKGKAHSLAVVRTEGDDLVVDIREMVASSRGMRATNRTVTAADVDDHVSMSVSVTCGCGRNYYLDVAPLLRGERVRPVRIEPDRGSGVPYDRQRPDTV